LRHCGSAQLCEDLTPLKYCEGSAPVVPVAG
jgi:hypothetical protein